MTETHWIIFLVAYTVFLLTRISGNDPIDFFLALILFPAGFFIIFGLLTVIL